MLKSLSCLLLSILILTQSLAYAYDIPLEVQSFHQGVYEAHRKMSRKEKLEILSKTLTGRPENEKALIRQIQSSFATSPFPELTFNENKLSFSYKEKTYELFLASPTMVIVNGLLLDLSPGKLEEAMKQVEKEFLAERKLSAVDLFIPTAHASVNDSLIILGWILVIGGLITSKVGLPQVGVVAILIGGVMSSVGSYRNNKDLKESVNKICEEIKKELASPESKKSREELDKILVQIKTAKKQIQEKSYVDEHLKNDLLYHATASCLNMIEQEVKTAQVSINNTDRGLAKEVPQKSSTVNGQTSKVKQQ